MSSMRVRRALGERRIGHTGTLDPAASGVLALVARPRDAARALHGRRPQALRRHRSSGLSRPIPTTRRANLPAQPYQGRLALRRRSSTRRSQGFADRSCSVRRPTPRRRSAAGAATTSPAGRKQLEEPLAGSRAGHSVGRRVDADRLRRRDRQADGRLLCRLLRPIAGPRPGRAAGNRRASRRLAAHQKWCGDPRRGADARRDRGRPAVGDRRDGADGRACCRRCRR